MRRDFDVWAWIVTYRVVTFLVLMAIGMAVGCILGMPNPY